MTPQKCYLVPHFDISIYRRRSSTTREANYFGDGIVTSKAPRGREPSRAGTGRILGILALAAGRGPAGPVISQRRPDFAGPGRAGFKATPIKSSIPLRLLE